MNITNSKTSDYDNKSGLSAMEKQSQTNPIKPNFIGFWWNGFLSLVASDGSRATSD